MAKKYKIKQEHEACISCGQCVSLCPDNWEVGSDGKSKPKKKIINGSELKCNKEAEENCPVNIIHIEEI